jgi:hypothetical protein
VSEIDWNHRELCPDGACTGLVGPDGVCKVCGKAVPNWGDERMRGLQEEPADADEDRGEEDEDDDEAYEDEDAEAPAEWSERKLCDDGACVGVIGSDGKCTVCGKKSAA